MRATRAALLVGSVSLLLALSSCSTTTPGRTSDAPTTSAAVFHLDRAYQYDVVIGHSTTTAETNDNVSVTLMALLFSRSAGVTQLQLTFFDNDTQRGAHFLFQELTNVYLVDDQGIRYQAIIAKPDDLVINPRQGRSVVFTFPLIHDGDTSLRVYVNTDRSALDIRCTMLTPNEQTAACGA